MKWMIAFVVFFVSGLAAHFATLHAVPGLIMERTMATMANNEIPFHSFRLAPAVTPQNQSVVRPSPDLAYSLCLYDLSETDGLIELRAGAFDGYGSIAVFDDQTNNIAAVRLPAGEETSVTLGKASSAGISATSDTGLILIRRLASTPQARAAVEQAALRDACAPTPIN
ncbi:MAG: DUF1254 domain-containing protein [Pseudomonadota bacterium]